MTDDAPATTASDRPTGTFSRSVTINRPRQELYEFWRDFGKLPRFMENLVEVVVLDETRSSWTVKAPSNQTVQWTARIIEEQPGQFLAWMSEEGADIPNRGSVTFRDAPGNRGTIVSAMIDYDPPGGAVGRIIAKMFQREPGIQVRRELRRFKQLMETGEIATSAQTLAARNEEED